MLGSAHGSALFTRGSTEVLCTATLGETTATLDQLSYVYVGPQSSGVYPLKSSSLHGPMVGYNQHQGMYPWVHSDDPLTWQGIRKLILNYDFPPYRYIFLPTDIHLDECLCSTGEVGASKGPNRRGIGHGALAEKALIPVLPNAHAFPYVTRLACEVRVDRAC